MKNEENLMGFYRQEYGCVDEFGEYQKCQAALKVQFKYLETEYIGLQAPIEVTSNSFCYAYDDPYVP